MAHKTTETDNPYLLSTIQIARLLGVSRPTILRYEEAGLLIPSATSSDGSSARLYDYQDVLQLRRILELKEAGLRNADIASQLSGEKTMEDVIAALEGKRNRIDQILLQMKALSNIDENIKDRVRTFKRLTCITVKVDARFGAYTTNEALARAIVGAERRGCVFDAKHPALVAASPRIIEEDEHHENLIEKLYLPCTKVNLEAEFDDGCTYERIFGFEAIVINMELPYSKMRDRIAEELKRVNATQRDDLPVYGLLSGHSHKRDTPLRPKSILIGVKK